MMKKISIGKLRALQQCSSSRGTYTCLAVDHRQNLRKLNSNFQDNSKLSEFKLDITKNLSMFATSVLLDPEISAGQAIARSVLPGDKGLIVALESTGYQGESYSRRTQILPGWSVEKAKRMGANMVKLLVYYHPKSKTAADTERIIEKIGDECKRYDMGLMLEPLSYSLSEINLTSDEKKYIVIETARRLTRIPGVDLLKSELPCDIHEKDQDLILFACAELSSVSIIPWILLSASVPFDEFLKHATIACKAGASGIAVGRAVWQETINMSNIDRNNFLRSVGRERMSHLYMVSTEEAKPWTDWYYNKLDFDWYKAY
jgi:tagatose-1,6-bisphosphate aldolase